MARLYDITRTLSPTLAVWPDDTPFSFQQVLDLRRGDSVNLTTLTLSAHAGTHTDAPWHIIPEGAHPADLPLEPYLGPARVVSIARRQGGMVPADFAAHDLTGVQRLLIRTWVSDLPDEVWPDDFPYPSVELIDWLAAQGLILLGVDVPSMDAFDSHNLPGHRCLLQHGIYWLETLCLRGVPDGLYELIALPLKIAGVCGSPVRAVLRSP